MKIKNFQDKLQLLRGVFLDVLDQNFWARCYFIKPYVLFNTGRVVTVLIETDFTFDEDPNALKLPSVSLHGDFLILEDGTARDDSQSRRNCFGGCRPAAFRVLRGDFFASGTTENRTSRREKLVGEDRSVRFPRHLRRLTRLLLPRRAGIFSQRIW